jgi:hypothetical protein
MATRRYPARNIKKGPRSPLKQLGGEEEEVEDIIAPARKKGTAAAKRLKDAGLVDAAARKKSKKVVKKGKGKANIPSPSPSPAPDEPIEPDGDDATTGLAFNFKHLAKNLARARHNSFLKRPVSEQQKVNDKISRDLMRINHWNAERAEERNKAGKRGSKTAKSPNKSNKKKAGKKVPSDEELEDGDDDDDDNGSVSDGAFLLLPLPHFDTISHYYSNFARNFWHFLLLFHYYSNYSNYFHYFSHTNTVVMFRMWLSIVFVTVGFAT